MNKQEMFQKARMFWQTKNSNYCSFPERVVVGKQNPTGKSFWARMIREGHLNQEDVLWCWRNEELAPGEKTERDWLALEVCGEFIDLKDPASRKKQIALESKYRELFKVFGR